MQSTPQTMDLTEKYSYGYSKLDNLTGGLHPGELTLICARPAMGKTAFALNIVNDLLKNNKAVAYFSLDESADQIISRLRKFKKTEHIRNGGLRIFEEPQMTVKEFQSSCEIIHNLGAVIIDYVQLLGASIYHVNNAESSNNELIFKLRDLKQMAQKLNVPVICLSQLSRRLELREDKRPILADLNDYDLLQQYADQILFLYRDDYYYENRITTSLMDVIIAKTPHSRCGVCKLRFDNNTCEINEPQAVLRADLHLHTIYSTKDGMMPVRDIAIKAKEMGLSAVAITDHGNVQGFPDAELASKKYGIKIIYGMECDCIDDLNEAKTPFCVTLLVKNKTGLKNLYQLISLSHMRNCCEEPPIPKSLLAKHRDGLLIGACCNDGEIMNALINGYDEVLLEAAQFYDYFEIAPRKDMQEINLRIAEIAEKLDKPVIATSDARYLTQEYALGHKVLRHCFGEPEAKNEWQHFRSTEEMLDNFSYLGEELCYKAVITNTQLLADICEEFDLFPNGRHFPAIKESAQNLTALCEDKIRQLYGKNPPAEVVDRLQAELDIILSNGYDGIYMLTRELALHSLSQGYPVGIRGVGGNSFVSFLLGITDFNPLPSHNRCSHCGYADFENNVDVCPICNQQMLTDGFDLPYEAFLGLPEDPKVPDFDLGIPKNCWKSTEKLLKDMFGEDHAFYAGVVKGLYDGVARQMVRTYASDKNIPFSRDEIERLTEQLRGIRIKDDFCISGHVIIPTNMEVTDFCPIQHCNGRPTVMTQFEYHYMIDALYKADIFIDKNLDCLHKLTEATGIHWCDIPLNDKQTFQMICSGKVDGIPEFDTKFMRTMVEQLKPTRFDDLVRIAAFGHDTAAWEDNAEALIKEGILLENTISTRDDVMFYLCSKGMDKVLAYHIMDRVRKGRGLTSEFEEELCDFDIPEWYIESCNKVRYLFPKSHCMGLVLQSFRLAWFKAHYPTDFNNVMLGKR